MSEMISVRLDEDARRALAELEVARNGGTWTRPPDDPEGDGTVAMIEGVAAGIIDEAALTAWIAERLA